MQSHDTFTLKIKRIFRYINDKFKSLMFEITARSELLNVTITYLNDAFGRISSVMGRVSSAFQESSKVFVSTFTDSQRYVGDIDRNFKVIDEHFEHSVSLTDEIHTLAKFTSDNLSVIHNITETTNVLSLNASIEAARAGAAGKGFAVVASEIRKHAGATREAVEAISKNISALTGKINILSQKMNTMKGSVHAEKELVGQIVGLTIKQQSALSTITGNMDDLNTVLQNYADMEKLLRSMVSQSQISKDDIVTMLGVFQQSLEGIEKMTDYYTGKSATQA
jgi:methyl-accepting chemotaxis protein